MNKKLMYAAMALPMLFTACSQDELFEETNGGMNTPKVKGYKVDLVTTKGDVAGGTRADWTVGETGAGLEWTKEDKISVYWLNTENGESAMQGHFNSVYETGDGENFTSKSLIYQGGNVAVFPADLAHTRIKTVDIVIEQNQGEDYANNTPYISNYLKVGADECFDNQEAGYMKPLFAPLKQAANVVTFDFTLKNTEELVANEKFNFQVTSVSLVARNAAPVKGNENMVNAFATKANIVNGDRVDGDATYTTPATDGEESHWHPYYTHTYTPVTKVLKVNATASIPSLTATYVKEVDREAGKYQATFVVLPTDAEGFNEYSDIVIETTCGRINLTTTETSIVNKEEVTVPVAEFTEAEEGDDDFVAPKVAGAITNTKSEAVWTIKQMLDNVVAYGRNTGGQFKGEQVGKTFMLSFEADMSNATLNDSKVYNSAMIENYVAIYKAMNSTEQMNLILSTQATQSWEDKGFNHLTKAAVDAVHSCNKYGDNAKNTTVNVTLSIGNVDKVWIEGGGEISAIINDRPSGKHNASMWAAGTSFPLYLRNAETSWVMNDTWSNGNVSEIHNVGTLTINGTIVWSGSTAIQQVLTEKVVNKGTLKIGGNNTLKVGTMLTNSGTVAVATDQDLRFNTNTAIGGTINVAANAFLTVEKDMVLTSSATINNYGTVSSVAGNGGIVNNGTINVEDDNAITYVQENNNTINLKNRDDEVKVEGEKGNIVYNYTAEDGSEFVRTVADKFTDVVFGLETETLELTENNIGDIDMTFNGITELITNDQKVRDLVVNGTLKLLTPDEGYSKVLYVRNLTNNGNITIGGTIYYASKFDENGTTRSVGSGAIIFNDEGAISNLEAAIAEGGEVSLVADLTLTETLKVEGEVELNMDGNEIAGDINVAAGADLTVKNGTISNENSEVSGITSNGNLTLDNVTVESARHALRIESGDVTINGGTYKTNSTGLTVYALNVGDDGTVANVTIHGGEFIGPKGTGADSGAAVGVKSGSTVTIYGGTFSKGLNSTLSGTGNIIIYGGKFDQDPSAYVADGYVATESNGWWTVSAGE